ncbi:hypothetical protein GX50_04703 [[Emmonsia] crescens]|uniref:Deacetylase sirtuin-type domain-containing protein n=1 Tax=[Emmonsia] crescens TaxID=73230 RepID=A0A2B7ZH73_9EURO|nr:hypothetical protein GX50_04703 [Emmonsia crescens]
MSREDFPALLVGLNPAWIGFLDQLAKPGALDTDDRGKKVFRVYRGGDLDVTNALHYYPLCPHCLENPPLSEDGTVGRVEAGPDGAISPNSNAGILKPAIAMHAEPLDERVKERAEMAIDEAGKLLVLGSNLSTTPAWNLVERARARQSARDVYWDPERWGSLR